MAYVMLAAGALMVVAGAYAAITGYNIVQVEQGWASVIAGASLFAGGVVTIAIALVLRALQSLETVLAGSREVALPLVGPEVPPLVVPPASPSLEAPLRPTPTIAAEDRAAPVAESAVKPERDAPAPGDDYKLETPSTPEHDLISPPPLRPVRAPAKSVPADDWLDRAFAEFDQEVTEPTSPDPAPVPVPALRASAPDVPPAATPSGAGPVTEETASAVIGRYEADGTSYVMYADGSIEAQTYSGVYRFASMAELKAFIES